MGKGKGSQRLRLMLGLLKIAQPQSQVPGGAGRLAESRALALTHEQAHAPAGALAGRGVGRTSWLRVGVSHCVTLPPNNLTEREKWSPWFGEER